MLPKSYYEEPGITIYHGDCRDILPSLEPVDLVLTDPPYGIGFFSNWDNKFKDQTIRGDASLDVRDFVSDFYKEIPQIIFGSWKLPKVKGTKMVLIWDKGTVGMGDLSLPWFPCTEEIYIVGNGFIGTRTSAVLRYVNKNYYHPTEKPLELIIELASKHSAQTILDPFMGSGTTLRAAKDLGRKAIGIELEEKYCEIAVKRLQQEVFDFSENNS